VPEFAPVPIISDDVLTIGEPITEADLPVRKHRRVRSTGPYQFDVEHKNAEDHLDYFIDLKRWLEPDESVSAADAYAEPANLYVSKVRYADTGVMIWLAGGLDRGQHWVHVRFETTDGKRKIVSFMLITYGVSDFYEMFAEAGDVYVGDGDSSEPDQISVTISDGVIRIDSDPVLEAITSIDNTSLSFPSTEVDDVSDALSFTITNIGTGSLYIDSITANGDYSASTTYTPGNPILPNASISVDVTFEPTAAGTRNGSVTIASNAGSGPSTVSLFGTATAVPVALSRLSISGNQFVDAQSNAVRLKSVNWFGAEGTNHVPHGLWARNYKAMIDQIKSVGFNCIRLAFSGDTVAAGQTPSGIDFLLNPDLENLSVLEIFDAIIGHCGQVGLYVVLDHHRRQSGAGADGAPTDGSYTTADWHASWVTLATRYADDPTVVGADIHNEPHNLTWADWATAAEGCGNAIHAVAPDWIIFVEGVGNDGDDHYWWGGHLKGVATRPVSLTLPNKVAYSPHEYGQSVGNQSWLAYNGQTPPVGWPDNLYPIWTEYWGFIFEQDIAPLWIGEFGGHFGVDATDGSALPASAHGTEEAQWVTELVRYLNGDFDNDDASDLDAGDKGISFAYWGWPPISADTGGILQGDFLTLQQTKLNLIADLLSEAGA